MASGKQSHTNGLGPSSHKKHSASSQNLFLQQTQIMQVKLLEQSQALSASKASLVQQQQQQPGAEAAAKAAKAISPTQPQQPVGGTSQGGTGTMQGQGTARS